MYAKTPITASIAFPLGAIARITLARPAPAAPLACPHLGLSTIIKAFKVYLVDCNTRICSKCKKRI